MPIPKNNPTPELKPAPLPSEQKIFNRVPRQMFIVAVTFIIASLVSGGGVWWYMRGQVDLVSVMLSQRTSELESQLYQLRNEYDNIKNQQNTTSYELISKECILDECLFNKNNSDYPLGAATIKGYYSPTERTAWGETKTCSSFTITGGSEELIRAMVHLVDVGNSVHTKNELNQPVINLGFSTVSESEKQAIFDSTSENQIEILVLSYSPLDRGVPVCHEDVWVLGVK